jgi:primosomal protein N' (replication factor Y) (superfamily II helicase)
VDEEHDLSFKQQDGFRYSARDLAVRRAQRAGCPAVLGSATPSLETLHSAQRGRYAWLHLMGRAGGAMPPRLDVIDIRGQPLEGGLSRVLVRDLGAEVAAGNQVLLFLNRRGFAPILTCHDCGWVGGCPHCDARLTLHLARRRLACHHCGWTRAIPQACPDCAKDDLRALGQGTERLEEEVERLFPGVPRARIDRDSTRGSRLAGLLEGARRGDFPILIGTQMLAKGHHLPGVTLVGILDLDQGLYGADYRAPERMAQLIVQVAGRAGRAERPGRVVLQTRHPDHPLLVSLLRGGYPAFAEGALAERRAALLPPFSHQALLRAEGRSAQDAADLLARAAVLAREVGLAGSSLWGPVPAPMERRAGRYRAQLLIQSERRAELQPFLATWVPRLRSVKVPAGARWSLDVDPQEML